MGYRERAALTLFVCRVSTMIIAFVFTLHVVGGTLFATVATQLALSCVLLTRSPVDFDKLRKPWAAPLVAYLRLCDVDLRAEFESIFRGWERQGGTFLLLVSTLFYWNAESFTGFVFAAALTHGIVIGLVLLRVSYALRATRT